MGNKRAVQFRKSIRTRYAYERLRQCKGCGNYTVLWDESCLKCGAENKLQPLKDIIGTVQRRSTLRDSLIIGAISLGAFAAGRQWTEMALSLLSGAVMITGFVLLRRRYAESERNRLLHQLLMEDNMPIREGILLDIEDAANDLKSNAYQEAYEKLREIGYLITGNQVKVLKLMCLNQFILRSDMDLELQTLIPDDFSKDFITYLGEVCKISPQLVNREALSYVVKNRVLIEALPDGRETLALVAGAALRVKGYVMQYEELIADYIDSFPRDRLLRLYRLVQESPSDFQLLYRTTTEAVKRKHGLDTDVQVQA